MIDDKKLISILYRTISDETVKMKSVADEIGVAPETISRWRRSGKLGRSNRDKVAAWLASRGVDLEKEEYSSMPESKKPGNVQFLDTSDFVKVPLLSVAQAAELRPHSNGGAHEMPNDETVYFDKATAGDFAVLVSGSSMEPWYPAGTKVLVGREDKPQTGDRVIAMIADYAEPIFKTYVDLGKDFALLSINRSEGCDPIIIDKMDRVAWYWVWPIKATVRIERDVDAAMKKHGIHHFWEKWLEDYKHKNS